jgi:hypothetical protein
MEGLLILCFTALSTLLALCFLKFSGGGKRKAKLPPGPWTLPIIGSLHHIISTLPHRRMTELSRRYGPVMLLKLGEVPFVLISSAEAVALVFKTNDVAFSSRPRSVTLDIFGVAERTSPLPPTATAGARCARSASWNSSAQSR